MMFAVPAEEYVVDPDVADVLRQLLILHADHEQNCSTSTVRMVGSARANLYASVSAGVSALWGPLHGGANQEVVEMLEQIAADGGNVQKYIDRAKDKHDHFRLMGFGHRVYRNYDPRARIIKAAAQRILAAGSAPTTTCCRSRCGSRRRRSPTSTSSSASSSRTSTSTAASSTARSASRRTCTRRSSRWAGCPAGSPSGAR